MPMEITMMMITMIHICSKPLVEIKYFKLMMTMIYFFSNIHDDDDVNANSHLAGDDFNAATQPAQRDICKWLQPWKRKPSRSLFDILSEIEQTQAVLIKCVTLVSSVYCQSECDLLMDGLLHFQLKPHNANPATRRAIFSLATWQIADIHKNCANTCNCPKIFVQIRSIVRKYLCKYVQLCANMKQAGILRSHTFSQTLQGDWKTMKKQPENLWDGIRKKWFSQFGVKLGLIQFGMFDGNAACVHLQIGAGVGN